MFFPENVYQLQETMFHKLHLFNILYSDEQKLFTNMAIFDFEWTCVQEDNFCDTDTKIWFGKHVQISLSLSSNLIEQPILLCNSIPGALVDSTVDALDGLATQSKAQMEVKFLEIETSGKSKLNQIFSKLNQRRCCKKPVMHFEGEFFEEEEQDVSTRFLYKHKRIKLLICRITWKGIATFFQSLASTARNTTSI